MDKRRHLILFVDDDPLAIKAIRRSVDDFESWEVEFALTYESAVELLRMRSFDAIVTDMLIPGLDGPQLLETISQEMPDVLRFVLTGNIRDAEVYRVVKLAHQMIPKPSDLDQIYAIVERACRLKDLLNNPQLLRVITGVKSLPSVPVLYNQLTRELQSNDPSPQRIGAVIAQDVGMTAKILQLVNSAFFGLAAQVSTPQRAVAILGINTIRSLVLGIDLFSSYQNRRNLPFSVDELWRHSVEVSNLTYSIARELKLSLSEQEEARVAGILHDVGKLLALNVPDYFEQVKPSQYGRIVEADEYAILGTSHAEMGGYLLGIWGLPNTIVEAVSFHHKPSEILSEKAGIHTALHTANGLINMWRYDGHEDFSQHLDLEYLHGLKLNAWIAGWSELACNIVKENRD